MAEHRDNRGRFKMNFKVVMTTKVLSRKDREPYERELGVEFLSIPCHTEHEMANAVRDADAVITFMQPFTRKVIEELNRCKLIYNAGAGYDTIDIQAATDHGICVAYPGDYCAEEVSEHTMALILACARKIVRLDRAVRAGKWSSFEKRAIRGEILPPVFQLKGQILGLIGFGRIGRAVVPKAKGFGLRVIAFDPYVPSNVFNELDVESVTFDYLLKESDFISIHTAFSPQVRHMLGKEQFKKMKSTAYVINTSRGSFIDEKALYVALSEGYIAGAGLDVLEAELGGVNLEHPLLRLDNVIVTAHSAYYSEQSGAKYKERAYEAIASIIRGEWPEWLINPEVKESFRRRWQQSLKTFEI
jgi:D-3-phosphoglycerate dehydrogenase